MELNKLIINNFGIYYGKNEFNFESTDSSKNIILIGGENGSGKTTFLTAVKVALYGPLVLGYKSVNASYIEFIKDKFNIYSLAEGDHSSSIVLDFILRRNGQPERYVINRQWKKEEQTIKEAVFIYKDEQLLSEKEIEDFDQFLRRNLPPTLFDFFFFDGEKVHQYVLNQDFETNIKEAFMTLFNLDLFEILQTDLLRYLRQENVFSNLTSEERQYTQIKLDVTNQDHAIQSLEKRLNELKMQSKESQVRLKELEKEFDNHGGIIAKERENLSAEILGMEQEKKLLSESIKDLSANLLPFVLQRALLNEVSQQIKNEEEVHQFRLLDEKLNKDLILNIFEEMKLNLKMKEATDDVTSFEEIASMFTDKLTGKIKPSDVNIENFNFIHELTNDQQLEVKSVHNEVTAFNGKSVNNKFAKFNYLTEQIYSKKKQIEHSLKDDALKEIVRRMNEEIKTSEQIKYEIEANTEKLGISSKQLEEFLVQLEKIERRVYQARKDENIFALTQRLNSVLSKYQKHQIEKYLRVVETYFLQMFNSLMRKGQFLNSFKIDPATFEISMLNHKNTPVFKHSFSAGETQIFFLSLLWALLKAAKADIPFVLDTLFGRLDHSHKENLITKYLPFSAKQVIILSTDTEIDEQYYVRLQKQIAKEFVIKYNRETNSVQIDNEYFFVEGRN